MTTIGRRQRRRVVVIAGVALLASIGSGMALSRRGHDQPPGLKVGWDGSEGHPACVYDPAARTVEAKVRIDGSAPRSGKVRVTVTAYADENTSEAVGSSSRSVPVDGTVHLPVGVTLPVEQAPHVDEDGVAACRLAVDY